MARLIFFLLVFGGLGYVAYRLYNSIQSRAAQLPRDGASKMIACERCGILVPEQDAIIRNNHAYCGVAHLEQK